MPDTCCRLTICRVGTLVQSGGQGTKVVCTLIHLTPKCGSNVPEGQLGLLACQLCTSFFGASALSTFPTTFPPNNSNADPGVKFIYCQHVSRCFLTLAADLDHIGILFSSVNNPQISSALACKVALTSTVAVFPTFDPEPEATGLSALVSDLAGGAGA